MRMLFVEPFYGGSHRAFADGLRAHSRHDIELLTLPGGEWRRRMRRGPAELAAKARALQGAFDASVATDMLDLPAFLALTRPRFAPTPVLYFLHENQFTYPRLRGTKLNSWFGQINYLSALAADRVAFNSAFHRADFLGALRTLAGQPNNWLWPEGIAEIERKAGVLPVGLGLRRFDAHRTGPDPALPPLLLWNHRWEFDKAPETFERAVLALASEGVEFRLALLGEPGDNPSPAFHRLHAALPGRIEHFGYVESFEQYARVLWESDIVVSTSRQEFFGVALVEAMYCGCLPIAPNRLNYPALVPPGLHARCLFDDEAGLVDRLRAALTTPATIPSAIRAAAARYDWSAVAPEWDTALAELARRQTSHAR
jgi:glycosyltransferase involved in cell wall biosynthesis